MVGVSTDDEAKLSILGNSLGQVGPPKLKGYLDIS